ncbi:MAG: 3-hydroxylacyl-ACP dehydratase [Pseudomonadales bacterium]
MSAALFDSVDELLPHSGEMVLISDVTYWDDESTCVVVHQVGTSVFADDEGNVPAWVGVEYMAQAVAIFAGIQAKLNDQPIRLGFLLGTRRYSSYVSSFPKNTRLDIRVNRQFFEENGIALFACSIYAGEKLLAEADIKAIQPDNVDELIGR